MRVKWLWLVAAVVILVIAGVLYSQASVSALDAPGRFETALATWGKRQIIARDAKSIHTAEPAASNASVNAGAMTFMDQCSSCHGTDGRKPTDIGRSMYPRVPDLGSAEVQKWSDPELFWIVQHGVRLSGMPGFGKSLKDEQIWNLVQYIRSISAQPKS